MSIILGVMKIKMMWKSCLFACVDQYSLVYFLCVVGKKDVTRLMLEAGANIHHVNSVNRTAAQMAAFVGKVSMSGCLLSWLTACLFLFLCLVDCLLGCMTILLAGWLTCWLAGCLLGWLTGWFGFFAG